MKTLLLFLLLHIASLASAQEKSSSAYEKDSSFTEGSVSASDIFHFGDACWSLVKQELSKEDLYDAIYHRREYLRLQKEYWRPFIERQKENKDFLHNMEKTLQEGSLYPVREGAGSAYFIKDAAGSPQFVLKPVDEDILCLNNRKTMGSIYEYLRIREGIPLYRSAQTDVLCYQVADDLGLTRITPKAVMHILFHEGFYDLSSRLSEEDLPQFLQQAGSPDREKLCSVQEYLTDSSCMRELVYSWLDKGLTDEQMQEWIDQEDFEDVNLFLWTIFDNDAHFGNVRTYVAYVKSETDGHPVYGLKKIDNGLSFPETNCGFSNDLLYFPNANIPISQRIKEKIFSIPVEKIIERMHLLDMQSAQDAFLERVQIIQTLAEREDITFYEMNLRLLALELPQGKEVALSFLSSQELEKAVSISASDKISSSASSNCNTQESP